VSTTTALLFPLCSGDYIRSDYEEKQAIATLQAIELVKRCTEVGWCRRLRRPCVCVCVSV
jgi:hypothetical protein